MLMNTTFLGDSFSIKWQSRVDIHLHFGTVSRHFFFPFII